MHVSMASSPPSPPAASRLLTNRAVYYTEHVHLARDLYCTRSALAPVSAWACVASSMLNTVQLLTDGKACNACMLSQTRQHGAAVSVVNTFTKLAPSACWCAAVDPFLCTTHVPASCVFCVEGFGCRGAMRICWGYASLTAGLCLPVSQLIFHAAGSWVVNTPSYACSATSSTSLHSCSVPLHHQQQEQLGLP